MGKHRKEFDAEFIRETLDYDPETGIFTWLARNDRAQNWNVRWAGKRAGYISNGYVVIQIFGKSSYSGQRLAWLHYYGVWPKDQVDHRDTNRANNRIANLREATNGQNMRNRAGPQKNGSSGFLGVHKHSQGWYARAMIDGVTHQFGLHDTPEAAAAARDAGVKALRDEFSKLNHASS